MMALVAPASSVDCKGFRKLLTSLHENKGIDITQLRSSLRSEFGIEATFLNEILATCENPVARDRSEISSGPIAGKWRGESKQSWEKEKCPSPPSVLSFSQAPDVASLVEKMFAVTAAVSRVGIRRVFISADGIFHSESSLKSCHARRLSFPPLVPLLLATPTNSTGDGPRFPRNHDSVSMAFLANFV